MYVLTINNNQNKHTAIDWNQALISQNSDDLSLRVHLSKVNKFDCPTICLTAISCESVAISTNMIQASKFEYRWELVLIWLKRYKFMIWMWYYMFRLDWKYNGRSMCVKYSLIIKRGEDKIMCKMLRRFVRKLHVISNMGQWIGRRNGLSRTGTNGIINVWQAVCRRRWMILLICLMPILRFEVKTSETTIR